MNKAKSQNGERVDTLTEARKFLTKKVVSQPSSEASGVIPEAERSNSTKSDSETGVSSQYRIYSPLSSPFDSHSIITPHPLPIENNLKSQSPCSIPSAFAPALDLPRSDKLQNQTEGTVPQPSLIATCSLNRSDWDEVQARSAQLETRPQRFLDMVECKTRFYRDRFFASNYLSQSSLLILSDWTSAQRYSFCSVPTHRNSSGECGLRQFCPYCAYLEQRPKLLEYVPAFHRGSWHFVTLSFSGALPFDSAVNAHSCRQYWDSCKDVLKDAVEAGTILGAFWSEEIAILQFLPILTMPHTHALIISDGLPEDFGETLAQQMTSKLTNLKNPMIPDVEIKSLETERSLYDRLCYMFKPIDLVRPYRTAWPLAEADNRSKAWALNSEVRDFLSGYTVLGASENTTGRRKKVERKGILHPLNRGYVGIPKGERDEYRQLVNEVGAQNNDGEEAFAE